MKTVAHTVNAIAAGCSIALAAIVFLNSESKALGAFLFSFGLLLIVNYRNLLYTGIVGYTADCFGKAHRTAVGGQLLAVAISWLGNLVGVVLVTQLFRHTRAAAYACAKANALVAAKLGYGGGDWFCLGILCGVLMFIAVHTYKKTGLHVLPRAALLVLCVVVFILSGFEHSIADMAYVAMSDRIGGAALWMLIVISLGNAAGGMAACFIARTVEKFNPELNS